jgi:hypothetical protein
MCRSEVFDRLTASIRFGVLNGLTLSAPQRLRATLFRSNWLIILVIKALFSLIFIRIVDRLNFEHRQTA